MIKIIFVVWCLFLIPISLSWFTTVHKYLNNIKGTMADKAGGGVACLLMDLFQLAVILITIKIGIKIF